MAEHVALKKGDWGTPTGVWVPHDTRDHIVDFVLGVYAAKMVKLPIRTANPWGCPQTHRLICSASRRTG